MYLQSSGMLMQRINKRGPKMDPRGTLQDMYITPVRILTIDDNLMLCLYYLADLESNFLVCNFYIASNFNNSVALLK